MIDYGIKPEWREAWKPIDRGRQFLAPTTVGMADLAVHLLAELKRERFEREHSEWFDEFRSGCRGCRGKLDPRHKFTADDWCAEARKELGK